jgi:kynurenine formamidase
MHFDGKSQTSFYTESSTQREILHTTTLSNGSALIGCNVHRLSMIPHCHGTHTETIAHILQEGTTADMILPPQQVPCSVISTQSVKFRESKDSYSVAVDGDESVIDREALAQALSSLPDTAIHALVIRTLPNDAAKTLTRYQNIGSYPFFTSEAMHYLRRRDVQHLLVDTPSVDRYLDDGLLSNHRCFWNICESNMDPSRAQSQATITELIYVPDRIRDGQYRLCLSYPRFVTDAVPSWPVLYSNEEGGDDR